MDPAKRFQQNVEKCGYPSEGVENYADITEERPRVAYDQIDSCIGVDRDALVANSARRLSFDVGHGRLDRCHQKPEFQGLYTVQIREEVGRIFVFKRRNIRPIKFPDMGVHHTFIHRNLLERFRKLLLVVPRNEDNRFRWMV